MPAAAAVPERFVRSLKPEPIRIVEKFDGPKLGAALEQSPPGRTRLATGRPSTGSLPGGRQSRGYIRTVATDFCDCNFICEVTIDVRMDAANLKTLEHQIFFGIGSGEPNPSFYDEMTCGLELEFIVDTGLIHVQAKRPDWTAGRPSRGGCGSLPNSSPRARWLRAGTGCGW